MQQEIACQQILRLLSALLAVNSQKGTLDQREGRKSPWLLAGNVGSYLSSDKMCSVVVSKRLREAHILLSHTIKRESNGCTVAINNFLITRGQTKLQKEVKEKELRSSLLNENG